MKNYNEFILLQALHLKLNRLCFDLLEEQDALDLLDPEVLSNLSIRLNGSLPNGKPIRPPRVSPKLWQICGAVDEMICILILQRHKKLTQDLWDSFGDEELIDLVQFNYCLTEEHDRISFRFPIRTGSILDIKNLKEINVLQHHGIIFEAVENRNKEQIVHVSILKKNISKYAMEVIDDNPIEYTEWDQIQLNIRKLW